MPETATTKVCTQVTKKWLLLRPPKKTAPSSLTENMRDTNESTQLRSKLILPFLCKGCCFYQTPTTKPEPPNYQWLFGPLKNHQKPSTLARISANTARPLPPSALATEDSCCGVQLRDWVKGWASDSCFFMVSLVMWLHLVYSFARFCLFNWQFHSVSWLLLSIFLLPKV